MANKEITMWSAPIVFEQIKQGPPGAQGAPGPAGPVYGITCSVDAITRGLIAPISPEKIDISASELKNDGTIKKLKLGQTSEYKIEIQNGIVDKDDDALPTGSVSFFPVDKELISLSADEKVITLLTTGGTEGYGYAKEESYYEVTSIKISLYKGKTVIVESSIPIILDSYLVELGQIQDGQVIINDGKVVAESIVSGAIIADKIAAGAIDANHLNTNRLDSLNPSPILDDKNEYTSQGSRIDFSENGSIHFVNFYVDKNGNAGFKGAIEAKEGSITGSLRVGTGNEVYIDGNNTEYVIKAGNYFKLTPKGELISTSGNIGGWQIADKSLHSASGAVGLYSGEAYKRNESAIRFYAGDPKKEPALADRAFVVTEDGHLYASNADVSGTINATSGNITGKLKVGPEVNKGVLIDGEEGSISSTPYYSGISGWKIDGEGNAHFGNAYIRGTLQSVIFEANTISAVGGDLYVAPTIRIPLTDYSYNEDNIKNRKIDFNTSLITEALVNQWKNAVVLLEFNAIANADEKHFDKIQGTISENIEFFDKTDEKGKIIRLAKIIIDCSSEQNWDDGITAISSDVTVIKIGQGSARHYIRLTANLGEKTVTPYMDVYSNDDANKSVGPKVRIGNLAGITDELFGGGLEGYGLYTNNAYLTGSVILPSAGISNQIKYYYNEEGGRAKYTLVDDNITKEQSDKLVRFWAGDSQPSADGTVAPFVVTQDGSLYATKGVFTGTVIAENSSFSGTIGAAGIKIDKYGSGLEPTRNEQHFFVGYENNPSSFDDYVLDISSAGLRIWEGGFNIYSDILSGWENQTKNETNANDLYGYTSTNINPYPYIAAIDSGRLALKDINIMSPIFDGTSTKSFSSIFSNQGALCFGKTRNVALNKDASNFYSVEAELYSISAVQGMIKIDTSTNFIIGKNSNYFSVQSTGNNVSVGSSFTVKNSSGAAVLYLNDGISIEEVLENGTSIGFNFLI